MRSNIFAGQHGVTLAGILISIAVLAIASVAMPSMINNVMKKYGMD
jgi:Tfp pilus assembly protein FimT